MVLKFLNPHLGVNYSQLKLDYFISKKYCNNRITSQCRCPVTANLLFDVICCFVFSLLFVLLCETLCASVLVVDSLVKGDCESQWEYCC